MQNTGTNRVLNVVVHVGNAVCHTDNVALFGICHPIGMAENAVADFCRQIQSLPVLLDQVNYTKALLIVPVPVGADAVENRFSAVPERRMSQIVPQCNGFGQILVEPQSTGNGTGNLCDFQRMGKTSAVVISGRGKENLCFPLEPPERVTVQDTIAVPLELRPIGTGRFRTKPAGVSDVRACVR